MKKYEIDVEATSFDGSQTFACYADNELDARIKFNNGLCDIIEQQVEVIVLGEILDVRESDDIASRLPQDEIFSLNEHIRLKEEECKQLAEDKLKLAKFISSIQMYVGDEVRMERLFEELGLDELVRGV